MANIPIRDIALTGVPSGSAKIAFDDGQMKAGLVSDLADGVRPVASQSEAEVGSDNAKTMTALRVKQSVAAEVGVSIASKAQGDFANTALQPAAIGTTVQAYDAELDAWSGKTAPTGSVVGTTDAQTLTNKTLTAPAISSPTGIVKADVGLGNVDNTSDAAKPVSTAAQTALDLKANTADLGTAAAAATTDFATAAQGAKADSAVQPGDLGALAAKSTITVPTDISATGTPSAVTYLRGDGSWNVPPGGGGSGIPAIPDITSVEALTPAGGDAIYLEESGRAGVFVFDAGDLSAQVTSDPQQGVYIAPSSGATGASGAWVRQFDGNVWADWFGADPTGTLDSTPAIIAAKNFLRSNSQSITNDGLTGKTITVYSSGIVELNAGVYSIARNTLRITQDLGFGLRGRGSRGMRNYVRGATVLLIAPGSASATDYGIQFYGNGSREGRLIGLDLAYADSSFTGSLLDILGSPGTTPIDCYFGTNGITGGTRLQTARAGIAIAWDEGTRPERCVFDGLVNGFVSDDTRQLAHFTGSISGTTLTITAIADGEVGVDVVIQASGAIAGTQITALGTGTGGVGTYTVNNSQTLSSRSMTCDIPFGGWDTTLEDCWFYDITGKAIYHSGNRQRLVMRIRAGINPISMQCINAIDLTNVKGLTIDNASIGGSVGNYATSGWLNLINCTGVITSGRLGPVAAAGTIGGSNSQMEVRDIYVDCANGFLLTGGVFRAGGNRHTGGGSGTSKAWIIEPTSVLTATFDPDQFDANVAYSYYCSTNGGNVNANITYNAELDSSVNSFAFTSTATGIRIENAGSGQVTISASGYTNLNAKNSGRLHVYSGTASGGFTLPTAMPGLVFQIMKSTAQNFDVNITGSPAAIYTGNGAAKTFVTSSSANTGNYLEFRAIGNVGWMLTRAVGVFTYS